MQPAGYKKPAFLLYAIGIILLLRLSFIGLMGIMPQDAYYDFYAQHPALSYYDHPPMIAYILRLFTSVFGRHVFALKLADSVVSFFSLLFFYRLAKYFLGPYRAPNALLLFFSTLMFTVISLVSTPDVPLILFWTLSLLTLYRAIFLGKKNYWLWSGICMGLAFDSKYTAVFLLFGLVLFLLLSAQYRRLLFSRWFLFQLLLFLITISPVIIWNVQNNFASFRFQSAGRVESMSGLHIDLNGFFGVVAHQSAILLPVLLVALIYFLFRALKKYRLYFSRVPADQLFLLCFFVPVFVGFFLLSFVYWVKLNWMMPAYISGIIWVSYYIGKKWINAQLIVSLIAHLLLAVEVLFYPVEVQSDDTWVGWTDLAKQVKQLNRHYPGAFIFSADDYKTSAVLDFYLDDTVYAQNIIGQRALQFDFVGYDLSALNGRDALFLDSDPHFKGIRHNVPPSSLGDYFDSVQLIDPIIIQKNGKPVRKFYVYLCRNYHAGGRKPIAARPAP